MSVPCECTSWVYLVSVPCVVVTVSKGTSSCRQRRCRQRQLELMLRKFISFWCGCVQRMWFHCLTVTVRYLPNCCVNILAVAWVLLCGGEGLPYCAGCIRSSTLDNGLKTDRLSSWKHLRGPEKNFYVLFSICICCFDVWQSWESNLIFCQTKIPLEQCRVGMIWTGHRGGLNSWCYRLYYNLIVTFRQCIFSLSISSPAAVAVNFSVVTKALTPRPRPRQWCGNDFFIGWAEWQWTWRH